MLFANRFVRCPLLFPFLFAFAAPVVSVFCCGVKYSLLPFLAFFDCVHLRAGRGGGGFDIDDRLLLRPRTLLIGKVGGTVGIDALISGSGNRSGNDDDRPDYGHSGPRQTRHRICLLHSMYPVTPVYLAIVPDEPDR